MTTRPAATEAYRRDARAALRRAAPGAARGAERDRLVAGACDEADAELRRNPGEAMRWARLAKDLACPRGAPAPDEALRWRVERGVAKAHHAMGDAQAALAALDRLGRRRLEPRRRADVESTRAILLARCGRPRAATDAARRAREAFRRLGDAVGRAHVDVNEANALHRRDEHAAARRLYLRALAVLQREGRDVDAAAARVGLGNACTFLGRVPEAEAAYRAAETTYEARQLRHAALVAAYNRHYLALIAGDAQAALDGLAEVAEGFRALGEARGVANCEVDRAEILAFLRCWPEARDAARSARERCGPLGLDVEAARATLALARAEAHLGAPPAVVAGLLDGAAAAFASQGNATGLGLVRVLESESLLRGGDWAGALASARRAAKALRRRQQPGREAVALVAQSRALRAGGHRGPAFNVAQRARRLRGAGEWARAEAATIASALALEAGDVAAARRLGREAVASAESLSSRLSTDGARLALLDDFGAAHRAAVASELAGARPRLARALAFAERARRFGLLEPDARAPGVAVAEWARRSKRDRGEPSPGLRRGTGPLVTPPRLRAPAGRDVEVQDITALQARLGRRDVLVEVIDWPGEERPAVLLVLTGGGLVLRELARGPRLTEAAERLAAAASRLALCRVAAPSLLPAAAASLRAALEETGSAVLGGMPDVLSDAERLLVCPPGHLASLPWSALRHDGAFLGERMEVVVLPAAAWLARPKPPRRGPRGAGPVLALGCADDAAPGIEDEVRHVAARWPGARALVGAGASWSAVSHFAPRARVLHVAAHGAFRQDAPERSALRLADGWVSGLQWEGLRLRADVVALSACQGAAAAAVGGDQAGGLVRSFLRAGAASVVASPWPIPDALAGTLWPAIHDGLAAGARPPDALRRVQRRATGIDAMLAWSFTTHGSCPD